MSPRETFRLENRCNLDEITIAQITLWLGMTILFRDDERTVWKTVARNAMPEVAAHISENIPAKKPMI